MFAKVILMLQIKAFCSLLLLESSVQVLHGLLHFSFSSSLLYFPSQPGAQVWLCRVHTPISTSIGYVTGWWLVRMQLLLFLLEPFQVQPEVVLRHCLTPHFYLCFEPLPFLSTISTSLAPFILSLFPFRMHFFCWMWSTHASFSYSFGNCL